MNRGDTIAALATGSGGAIAMVRVSGGDAIAVCDAIFMGASSAPVSSRGSSALSEAAGYTLHYGRIVEGERVLDDVVVSVFRAPRSYTGEDMVEISCHGSSYITSEILKLLIRSGARAAEAGEFTVRAFMGGKIDLSQAEAVADMIASRDRAAHALASNQMRGGYSADFSSLRGRLLELVSLLELELDFGEEDVEFASRGELSVVVSEISGRIARLLDSFGVGNAIKEGVAVAIVGATNVGKSTLLNTLLRDDRAMVSDIAGTTRDVIEERLVIDGVAFRLIDTAGMRSTDDVLEQMGIQRTISSLRRANIVLLMVDGTTLESASMAPASVSAAAPVVSARTDASASASGRDAAVSTLRQTIDFLSLSPDQQLGVVVNKSDIFRPDYAALESELGYEVMGISAKTGEGIERLTAFLSRQVDSGAVYSGDTVLSNSRHYEALHSAGEALRRVAAGLDDGLAADLLSHDIREALYHIGTITGEITTDEILGSIFSKFCIGK